jgi:thioredoxin-like negative regulator of GroEL
MAPVYQQVASKFADSSSGAPDGKRVQFVKVNTEAVPEVAAEFNIRSIPTLAVLVDGEVIDSNVGLSSADALNRMAQRALDRAEGRTFGQRIKRFFAA